MALIEVKNLTKIFGNNKALDEVCMSVENGESFGIVGESGSGKTTLARVILKLIKPTSGEVIYGGGFSRKDYQIVFQNPYTSLDPRMKVRSILSEPLKINKMKKDLSQLLSMVELDDRYLYRYPHELSGGERQRLSIARAISIEPKCIVLDEPVSSLDMKVQLDVLKLLKKIREQMKLTYIFISHDLSVIRYMCDKVAVMKSGDIIEEGKVFDVYSSPKLDYTKALIRAIPELSGQI
jgi:peptide/nickel transport system ATP-binding protein